MVEENRPQLTKVLDEKVAYISTLAEPVWAGFTRRALAGLAAAGGPPGPTRQPTAGLPEP